MRPLYTTHPLPGALYLHGAVLTLWFLLTVLQAWLIRTKHHQLHRRIGFVVAGYAVFVVALGLIADARMAAQIDSPQDSDNIAIWGNLFTLVLFTAFVSLAVVMRKRPDAHRRLTLLASMSIVGPALARFTEWPIFPGGIAARPFYRIGALMVHDVVVRRRPHPATWLGALAILASLGTAACLAISGRGYGILHGV